jgi:hypothetical protein
MERRRQDRDGEESKWYVAGLPSKVGMRRKERDEQNVRVMAATSRS